MPRRLRLVSVLLTVSAAALASATPAAPARDVIYVANAENFTAPQVRYTGRPWIASQGGYLEGTGKGQRLLGQPPPGSGDFVASLDLSLAREGRESSIVVDSVGEIAMRGETGRWELRGRFFRAGSTPIPVQAPVFAAGREFPVSIARTGGKVRIVVDGVEVYAGSCGTEAISSLGLDPGTGTIRLNTFTVSGNLPAGGGRPFDNPFGMQLRSKPVEAGDVRAPVIVREAPTNECSLVARHDGTLELYHVTKPSSDSISVMTSRDGGLTWSESRVAFALPGKAYYAVKAVEDLHHDLQLVYHLFGQGEGGYNGRLYEVYHTTRKSGSDEWTSPQRVVPGYVGSIRGLIALSGGRLLLAVGKAMPGRRQAPATGPDFGWHDTLVFYSDDYGRNWQQSPDRLQVELRKEFPTRYGAVEPVMIERTDGSVWMLIRDRGGWLWESESRDGARWSNARPTRLISSDSPAELLRLHDGRIVLLLNACQNWGEPLSYAAGGREVLQAAVSHDDGRTWRGFREVLHETNLIGGGDRGSAYPSAAETPEGKVAVVSGQGHGKHAIVLFDPDWLEEDGAVDDLTGGPTGWTQYGDEHLRVKTLEEGPPALAIPLKSSGRCGASWNFPMTAAGSLELELRVPRGVTALKLSLNDHFTRVDDTKAAEHAVYTVELPHDESGEAGWRTVRLEWQDAAGTGALKSTVRGGARQPVSPNRPAVFGLNYLRVEFVADRDAGELLIRGVRVKSSQP